MEETMKDKVPQFAKDIARAMVGEITTTDEQLEEALFPQDISAVSSVLGDTCPRCGTALEHSEGLERDYPDCPACRYVVAPSSTCPRCGGERDCAAERFGCTCEE
jgi:rRNA maturation protein Nop10